MEAPEDIQIALRNIRDTMHLRWNPVGKVLEWKPLLNERGQREPKKWEPRWEVWDVSPVTNREYRVMQLCDSSDGFRQPGMWLVHLLRVANPENHGGDMAKAYEAATLHLLKNQDTALSLADHAYKEFRSYVAEQIAYATTRHSRSTPGVTPGTRIN